MAYIASYSVPRLSGRRGRIRFFLRDEYTPNARAFATRFDTQEQAEAALDVIREDISSHRPGAEFHVEPE